MDGAADPGADPPHNHSADLSVSNYFAVPVGLTSYTLCTAGLAAPPDFTGSDASTSGIAGGGTLTISASHQRVDSEEGFVSGGAEGRRRVAAVLVLSHLCGCKPAEGDTRAKDFLASPFPNSAPGARANRGVWGIQTR